MSDDERRQRAIVRMGQWRAYSRYWTHGRTFPLNLRVTLPSFPRQQQLSKAINVILMMVAKVREQESTMLQLVETLALRGGEGDETSATDKTMETS